MHSATPFGDCAEFGRELEIATVCKGKPHVVILGAGASRQACPRGDRDGRILPLMKDLIEVVGLGPILARHGIEFDVEDFERIYSQLAEDGRHTACREMLERRVREYFSSIRLPEHPTVYDHLVLSLRPRDVIATFNWDPLLVEAARRNSAYVEIPRLLFLHGNVCVGWCEQDMRKGSYPETCSQCGQRYQPTRLLYPVQKKDYLNQPFVKYEWQALRDAMSEACVLTIFGFGAPETDVEAVELLRTAWPTREEQTAQWVELINTEPHEALRDRWDRFILSHHYDVTADFYESRIARHPRRSSEAWAATCLCGMFEDGNPLPREVSFPELWEWYGQLREVEGQSMLADEESAIADSVSSAVLRDEGGGM